MINVTSESILSTFQNYKYAIINNQPSWLFYRHNNDLYLNSDFKTRSDQIDQIRQWSHSSSYFALFSVDIKPNITRQKQVDITVAEVRDGTVYCWTLISKQMSFCTFI